MPPESWLARVVAPVRQLDDREGSLGRARLSPTPYIAAKKRAFSAAVSSG